MFSLGKDLSFCPCGLFVEVFSFCTFSFGDALATYSKLVRFLFEAFRIHESLLSPGCIVGGRSTVLLIDCLIVKDGFAHDAFRSSFLITLFVSSSIWLGMSSVPLRFRWPKATVSVPLWRTPFYVVFRTQRCTW